MTFVHGHPIVSARGFWMGLLLLICFCCVSAFAQEAGTSASMPVQHVQVSVDEMLAYEASVVLEKILTNVIFMDKRI